MPELELQYGIVGFFDILGFSEMVDSDAKTSDPTHLPIFLEVFANLAGGMKGPNREVRMFSDSIVVSADLTPQNIQEVIGVAGELQRLFLQRGILIRGGIAFGKHFANESIIFSQALVSAYRLESKVARFPRIVVEKDAINYAWHDRDTDDHLREKIKESILVDRDGAMFVHYLTQARFDALTSSVRACIESKVSPEETVLEKKRWLLDYQNYCSSLYGEKALDTPGIANGFSKVANIF